jgi:hypothetical protein
MLSGKSSDGRPGHPLSLWLPLAVWLAAASMPAVAAADTGRAIPPGQEELLGRMLGRGEALPGDCRLTGGGVEATIVVAYYTCSGAAIAVELHDVAGAASDLQTEQFAVVVRSGAAPPALLEALAARIREHEPAFEWRQVSLLQKRVLGFRLGAGALAACASGILILGLVAQLLVARRCAPPQSEPHLFVGRGRVTALGELLRRRRRLRDVRILAAFGVLAFFFFTRMSCLTCLPAYVDETVHIHWARSLLDSHFTSEFSVGRWLPIRIMSVFLLMPVDELFAARLGSVAMGAAILIGCVLINRELFSSTEGLLAGVVYTLLPYSLLYDRLALADVYLVAFGAWVVYFSILAARRRGVPALLAMSLCCYAAILSKPTGGVFLLVPLVASVFLAQRGTRASCLRSVRPTPAGGTVFLCFLIWAGYGTELLTSQAAFEGRRQVAGVLLPNLAVAGDWLSVLLTPPVALAALAVSAAALLATVLGARTEPFLACLLALAILPSALVSRTWYPSYLLFAVVPIALLLARAIALCGSTAGRALARVRPGLRLSARRTIYTAGVLLISAATAPLGVALVVRPEKASLPWAETSRFVSGGLSGYGLSELAAFLRAQAQAGPINVMRFDLVQPPNHGLDLYLPAGDGISLHTIDHRDEHAGARIASLAAARRTLFVSNPEVEESMGARTGARIGRAALVWSYERPGSETRLQVWEIERN